MTIENPEISWENNVPYSLIFKDIYYSRENGLAETQHVFIQGNDLIHRWKNSSETTFVIFEAGFGTGLNFCATSKAFLENTDGKVLNYISVEKYPLSGNNIQKALECFPEIKYFSDKLILDYPVRFPGIHKIFLIDQKKNNFATQNSKIILTLIFNDRVKALEQMYLTEPVKAWFLDGFSPSTNEKMWSTDFLSLIAKFSSKETTLSTFSSAGRVRRSLEACGFQITKISGFAGKREMITGKINAITDKISPSFEKPWYYVRNKYSDDKSVAIIGAGLSGCALASSFAGRNWNVQLIEQNEDICCEASGNPLGIFFPVIHRKPTFTSRFSALSYFHLIRHIRQLIREGHEKTLFFRQNGLLQLFENPEEIGRFSSTRPVDSLDSFYERLNSEEIKSRFGIKTHNHGGVFFNEAGFISPKGLCAANLNRYRKSNPVNQIFSTAIDQFYYENGMWTLLDKQKNTIISARILVLANSWAISHFSQTNWLPLQKIRGQLLKLPVPIPDLTMPLSSDTYIIPDDDGIIIGATHDRFDDPKARDDQNKKLLQSACQYYPALKEIIPELQRDVLPENLISRVSFRSAADDHFPVIGRVPDRERYLEIFDELKDGETNYYRKNENCERPEAWHENLYCLTGCGSRGILYSHLGAEMIASLANISSGDVLPLQKDIYEALSPARFLYRLLKRG